MAAVKDDNGKARMTDARRVIELSLIILPAVSCIILWFLAWFNLWPWVSWTFNNLEYYVATDPIGFVWFLLHFVPLSVGVLIVFACLCYLIATIGKLIDMIKSKTKKTV